MKKYLMMTCAVLALAGCAMLAPEGKFDLSGVKQSDRDNLKAGILPAQQADAAAAVADVLKARGFAIEKDGSSGGVVTTANRHGVTMYGSCDYQLSCAITPDAAGSALKWSVISHVSEFVTNTDHADADTSAKWNAEVYAKLMEKGVIAAEATPVPAATPAATAAPEQEEKPDMDENGLPVPQGWE